MAIDKATTDRRIGSGAGLRFAPSKMGAGAVPSMEVRPGFDRLEFFLAGAAVFLAPMNFLRHPSYYITLGDVFAFACLFVMLLKRSVPLRPLGSGSLYWMIGLMMLIGGLFASSIINGSPERGLIVSAQYYVAYFILPFVFVSRPWPQVISLIQIFLVSIILLCIHGVYLIHIDGETNTQFVTGSGRLRSFMERENALASIIALTSPLLLWLGATGCVRRIAVWLALPLLIYGVMLTGSNTGLLAMLYGFAVYGLAVISWRRFTIGLGGIAAVLTVFGFWGKEFLPAVFQKRVLGALESGDIDKAGTFSHRYDLMVEAQEMINDSVLLGLGADQHRVVSEWGHPVHNAYLLIWSEGGLIALVGFLLIVLGGLLAALSAARRPGGRLAALCTFCSVTELALLANAVTHPYGRFWIVPILLALAVSVAYAREGPAPRCLRRFARD